MLLDIYLGSKEHLVHEEEQVTAEEASLQNLVARWQEIICYCDVYFA